MYYIFGLTQDRQYTEYKNPRNLFVLDKIESGMNQAEGIANKSFIRKKLRVFSTPTMHYQEVPNFQYMLTIVHGARIVTVKDMENNSSRPLEQRRDLYENQGDFYWGDDDIGCQFLAVSILAHHFNGDLPEDAPVAALRDLLQSLNVDDSHVIESQQLSDLKDSQGQQSYRLQKLESEYYLDPGSEDIAFFEVLSALDRTLTIRCANGIVSIVDTTGYSDELIHKLSLAKILLPGIERNGEPIREMYAVRLSVERDTQTGKIVRILDAFDSYKLD